MEKLRKIEQKLEYNITGILSKNAQGKLGEMIKDMQSINEVEQKFNVGDWIYHEISGNSFHINRIENRTYISDEGATISFGRQNDWRLWTIQDAKDC